MKLSQEEVEHVARLARLKLTHEERESMAEVLSAVLQHMESLGQPEPADGGLKGRHRSTLADLRADVVDPWTNPGRLLALGPEIRNGQFVVPRIVAES